MINHKYDLALSRSDLSQWLVHFSHSLVSLESNTLNAEQVLHNIIREGFIRPSLNNYITQYCNDGAACFYDSPPSVWQEILKTNPSDRQGFGIIVARNALWFLGGRPVIYTDNIAQNWPVQERYRLVYTDLTREPYPADWTHEREWRIKGGLKLNSSSINEIWWWPVVPSDDYLQNLWELSPGIVSVYVMNRGQVVPKPQNMRLR
ncbi:MAG: hypothetical protein JW715_10515 [Sedimentisphaerales bacterium]|nr:hypothetical protein [Sedimentisphaerales bacterium]